MVKLVSTAAASDRSGVKVLVFGPAKTGKTTMIKTAPAPVIFSSEKGLLPLRGENLPVVEIASYKDLDEALAWLGSSEARNFKTVAIDSITDLADMLLIEEQKNNPKKNDKWYPFNQLAEKMTQKLRTIRDTHGRHFYMICQQEIIMTPEGTRQAVPSLPGKALLQALPYLFDGVFQMVLHVDPVTGAESRALKIHGDSMTLGGDRSGNLAPWEPPDLSHIFAKMLS